MSDTTPATETANTPGPADSPGEPSNPPDGTSTESGAVASRGTNPEPSDGEKVDAAYDPSQPPYTGEDEDDDDGGKGKGKGARKSTSKRTVSAKEGNKAKQTPPK